MGRESVECLILRQVPIRFIRNAIYVTTEIIIVEGVLGVLQAPLALLNHFLDTVWSLQRECITGNK